jgi:hypothetical protein
MQVKDGGPALSVPQMNWLSYLAGLQVHRRLLDPRGKRQVIASLIDGGLINADGWAPTEKGHALLTARSQEKE